MRQLGFAWVLVVAAACSESGAHFTLSAPTGPDSAASFQVILATPQQIPSIANQRMSPDSMATQTVPYYLQRTIAGASEEPIDHVDGLRIKLEANFPAMSDSTFIPFVLLYDAHGAIVGVGTYRAEQAVMPSPVIVMPDEIDKYTLVVEPVMEVDDRAHAGAGQVQLVDCFRDDQSMYTSGIVWRPLGGGELRILFPNDGSTDATGRALDLDCDGHVVSAETSGPDCDDARAWFNRDMQETCDGFDTNCDGLQNIVVTCPANTGGSTICPNATTGGGIELCDDRGTGTPTTCQSDPACLCANGSTSSGCIQCRMMWQTASVVDNVIPCQPGIGTVTTLTGCTATEPCTVEIVAVHGGWKAEVANDLANPAFGPKATNVGLRFVLKVKRPEGPGAEIPGAMGKTIGEVDVAITPLGRPPHLLAIDLAIVGDGATNCQGSGPYQMSCTP